MKLLTIAMFALMLSSCATPPVKSNFDNSTTVSSSYDATWEKIVGFFAFRNIPLKNIAKDSGVIYAESMSFDNEFADCGSFPLMTIQQRIMSVNVFVQRKETSQVVRANTTFREMLVGPYNTMKTVQCQSKGVVEKMVLEAVR